MNILHVIPAFYPASVYGGPIESSYQLCRHLARTGNRVRVLTTDANGPSEVLNVDTNGELKLAENFRVCYCHRLWRGAVSPIFLRFLPSYVRWADVVHLTAVYSFPTIPTLAACHVLKKPVVWSPRGALQRWEQSSKRGIKVVWEGLCRAMAPSKLVLHVTSEEEAQQSLTRIPHARAAVIPNGVEIPVHLTHKQPRGVLRLVYLGRLHPIKGIENLLSACRGLNLHTGLPWSLTIAGDGDPGYADTLRGQVAKSGLAPRVIFIGTVSGESKRALFEDADVVMVPSHTENFGMVVAEALAHAVPVIASKGTPWRRVEEIGCGLWVENDAESLAKAIEQIRRMPIREMGRRGREWMAKEFSWDKRAQEVLTCYNALGT